jgi:hypothetical protein
MRGGCEAASALPFWTEWRSGEVSDLSLLLSLPGRFVLDRVVPTPSELTYGYRLGWIAPAVAVELALAGLGVFADASAAYEELALLLSDRLDEVPQLIDELARAAEQVGDEARVWLFLALCWVYENRETFTDPLAVVEQLYADFEYPEETEGFVRFLPVPEGVPTGVAAVHGRWAQYLEKTAAEYRGRSGGDG